MSSGVGYNKAAKRATACAAVPVEEHWAIIENDSVWTSSGYDNDPGGSHEFVAYYVFLDEKAWREEVTRLFREAPDRKDIRAVHVEPINPRVDIKIEVKF